VEIKPKRLWNSVNNNLKFEVARKFCLDNGYKFKLIDPVINSKLILKLYHSGDIKFLDRYDKKFRTYVGLV
jgi:hypothetical protein